MGVKIKRKKLIDVGAVVRNAPPDITFAVAGQIQRRAVLLVPKDTANLAKSIKRDRAQGDDTVVAANADGSAPYAARIEYGFVGTDSLGRSISQNAQPYMRPAADWGRRLARDIASKILRRNLRRGR